MNKNKDKKHSKHEETKKSPERDEEKRTEQEQASEQELQKLRDENAQLQEKLMRLMAEFDNFRKRQQKILENMIEQERNNVIGRLIEIAADVDRALAEVESGSDPKAIYEGIKMVSRRIKELLRLEGIESVDPMGMPFDPLEHEAIGVKQVQDEELHNIVVDVLQPVYKRGGKLVAPAKVIVGQYQPPQKQEDENGNE